MSTSSPTPDQIEKRFNTAATRLERLDTQRINVSATILVSLGWVGASCLLGLIASLMTGSSFLKLWVMLALLGLLVPIIRVGYRVWAKERYAHYAKAIETLRSQGQCIRPLSENEHNRFDAWRAADTRAKTYGAWTIKQDETLNDFLDASPPDFTGQFERGINP